MRPPLFTPPSVDPKVRRWQATRSILIIVAIIAAFPALYLFESWRGKRAWQAYEREAEQRGVKMTLAEIVPPPVPDAENFARCPILDASFTASDANEPVKSPLNLAGINENDVSERPKGADFLSQRMIDLEEWREYLVDVELLDSTTDNVAADVLRGLDSVAESLGQLRAAGRRPRCQFPVRWEKNFAASLPHLRVLQDGARVFALRVSAHLAIGNSAAAYEEFRDGLRLVTAIRDEPSLISALVRVAMTNLLLNAVWGGLEDGNWADPELRRIEADLAGLDWLQDYVFSLNSERWSIIEMGDVLTKDPRQFAGVSDPGTGMSGKNGENGFRFYPAGWFQHSKVRFNRYIDELTGRVDLEQRRIFTERPLPSSPSHLKRLPAKFYYLYFAIAAPVYESIEVKYSQIAAFCDMARLGCALERRRLARGDFPDQLADLAPDFVPSIPVEVLTGEPYRYRRTDAGSFVLYSTGKDMQDDGGVVDPKLKTSKQKDWVWRAAK